MAKRTGKDLAFTIGGTAVALMREWSLDDDDVNVESTAAGDDTVDRDSLRGDYTVQFKGLLEIAAPYVIPSGVRGTKVAWVGKIIDSDTNGIASSTGLVTKFSIKAPYDNVVEISGEIKAAGTAVSYDLSPAS